MKPKKRKKLAFDPNKRFAKVPDIDKARMEMYRLLEPKKTSKTVKKLKLEDLCHEWQLQITGMPDHSALTLFSIENVHDV